MKVLRARGGYGAIWRGGYGVFGGGEDGMVLLAYVSEDGEESMVPFDGGEEGMVPLADSAVGAGRVWC